MILTVKAYYFFYIKNIYYAAGKEVCTVIKKWKIHKKKTYTWPVKTLNAQEQL